MIYNLATTLEECHGDFEYYKFMAMKEFERKLDNHIEVLRNEGSESRYLKQIDLLVSLDGYEFHSDDLLYGRKLGFIKKIRHWGRAGLREKELSRFSLRTCKLTAEEVIECGSIERAIEKFLNDKSSFRELREEGGYFVWDLEYPIRWGEK